MAEQLKEKLEVPNIGRVREGKTKWKQIQKTGKTIYKKAAR